MVAPLIKLLGRGRLSVVRLACDEELEREVALKSLPEEVMHGRALSNDLKQESTPQSRFIHPDSMRTYDFVQDKRSACISMEYSNLSGFVSILAFPWPARTKAAQLADRSVSDDAYLKWKGTSRMEWLWRGLDTALTARYRDGFHKFLAPNYANEHRVKQT